MSKYLTRLPPNTSPELSRALSDAFRDLFNDLIRQGRLFVQDVDPRDTGAILVDGARWLHSETSTLYTWVDDGTSAQWVELCCGGGGGGGGGSGITALTGDVTASGTGSVTATIANDAVTYAKMQNVSAASRLLGRGDSGPGDPQEITLGTNLSMSGTTLNATGGGSSDTKQDVTATATTTINYSLGNIVNLNLAASITTFSVTNAPASGTGGTLTIYAKQDSGGSKTITWPAAVKWSGGIAPVLTTTASRTDVLVLTTWDGGTNWFGYVGGYDFNV